MKYQDRIILAIDLKSFYASVECIDRNMDPFTTPLVVADESRGDGTIVLAASPFIKEKYHVKSRCRLYDVPKDIPGLIIAQPKMRRYLEVSASINKIYQNYVSEEDMHIYSIDESFLDVTDYLQIHHDTAKTYARKIIKEIKSKTGLTVTAGIGKNLFMAKACMDIEAKHSPEFLSEWDYEDIPAHLWPITPLSKMWGIGRQLEKRLNAMGFYSIGDIAISDPEYLKKALGVIGDEIYQHSHGIDDARIQDVYVSKEHSLSAGQVLLRDYYPSEMTTLVMDMAYELSDRMYESKVSSLSFLLYLGLKDHDGGYAYKVSFYSPTASGEVIGREFIKQYLARKDPDAIYRTINLVACNVTDRECYQMSLFEDYEEDKKIQCLDETLIHIRRKYGVQKAMPCSALTLSSTYLQRANQIGGHHA